MLIRKSVLFLAAVIFFLLATFFSLSEEIVPALLCGFLSLWIFGFLFNETDFLHRENPAYSQEIKEGELFDSRAVPVFQTGENRKAVMLIHGFGSCPWLFYQHIPLFKEAGYDVIAPLHPGHGQSAAAFVKSNYTQYFSQVEDLLKQWRPRYDSFHVVGISMGGLLSLQLAEEYSSGPLAPDSYTALAAPAYMNSLIKRAYLRDWRIYLIRVLGLFWKHIKIEGGLWNPENDGGEEWIGYKDLYPKQIFSVSLGMKRVISRLGRITAPLLLIHSREDKDAPFGSMAYIAGKVKSHELHCWAPDLSAFDHSRHALFLYKSLKERLFHRIIDFIKEQE